MKRWQAWSSDQTQKLGEVRAADAREAWAAWCEEQLDDAPEALLRDAAGTWWQHDAETGQTLPLPTAERERDHERDELARERAHGVFEDLRARAAVRELEEAAERADRAGDIGRSFGLRRKARKAREARGAS